MDEAGQSEDTLKKMNVTSVPLAVFISALLAVAGVVFGIRGEEKAAVYKQAYERDLVEVTLKLDALVTTVARLDNAWDNHIRLEGHPGMQSRVRELELGR